MAIPKVLDNMFIEITDVLITAGFFEPENVGARKAFNWTIVKLNLQRTDILIVDSPEEVTKDDSFQVSKQGRPSSQRRVQLAHRSKPPSGFHFHFHLLRTSFGQLTSRAILVHV